MSGSRALWLDSVGGKAPEWRLWTASTTSTTPRRLVAEPQPVVVGSAGGGLLPYAIDTTVMTLRANGKTAFTWTAPAPVVALAASNGRVAVADEGSRVAVLDAQGKVVSVDLYMSSVSAVALTAKWLVVQRGTTIGVRHEAEAHEYPITADSRLGDADARWALWVDGKLVHVIGLPEGTQVATFPGTAAALAGNRLYVANGRTITVRTIR